MRAVVPYLSAWIGMLLLLGAAFLIEARRTRTQAVGDIELPVRPPSPGLGLAAAALLGPLVAPIYFWASRRTVVGIALGLGAAALSLFVFLGVHVYTRALVWQLAVTDAHAACLRDPATPAQTCAALIEAYETGKACADGAALVPCTNPVVQPFVINKSPERAREIRTRPTH